MTVHRSSWVASLVLVASLAAMPASGQQRDSTRVSQPSALPPPPDSVAADTGRRPFVRGGIYDKPFQTRLLGRTAVGGYAEAHARYERVEGLQDEAGFEA